MFAFQVLGLVGQVVVTFCIVESCVERIDTIYEKAKSNVVCSFISLLIALLSICIHIFKASNVGLQMSTATETDKMAALATAADEARGLAMDSIAAAHSGHMGLPLGAAEIGAVLYGSQVSSRE